MNGRAASRKAAVSPAIVVVTEVTYDPEGDTLQVWFVEDRIPTVNKEQDEGRFLIVALEDPHHVVGWEIVNFSHYASVHPEWRTLADTFGRLPGGEVTWRQPSPGSVPQQLISA
jgi:hypothetical protein